MKRILAATPLCALLPSTDALAQEENEWSGNIAFYLQMASMDSVTTVGEITIEQELGFDVIWEHLDGAFSGHGEVMKNRIGAVADVVIMRLGQEDLETSVPGLSGFFSYDLTQFELFGAYRLGDLATNTVDVFGGLRWRNLTFDIGIEQAPPGFPLGSAGFDESWTDPVLGARWIGRVRPRLKVTARGDIAFSGNSDFTWNLQGGVLVTLWRQLGLVVQYKYLDIKHESGSGDDFFRYDAVEQGPLFAIVWEFGP